MTVNLETSTTCDFDSWSCQPSLASTADNDETNSIASSIGSCYATFDISLSTMGLHPRTIYSSEGEEHEDEGDSILSSASTTSSAVLESKIQVMFSEQMAREMQEVLQWYKMDQDESDVLKRTENRQSVVLASNSLVVDFVSVAPTKAARSPPSPQTISPLLGRQDHQQESATRLLDERNSHQDTVGEQSKQVSTVWLSVVHVAQLLYGGC